jgi:periplasmic protein CpxP/Spy
MPADQIAENSMPEQSNLQQPSRPPGKGRTLAFLMIALTAGLFGAFASTAFSQGFGPPWNFVGPPSMAQIEDRADRAVRHLAIEIDATADQQSKLQAIVRTAITDLLPLRDKVLAVRQQARQLLTQPTVDRAAVEHLRSEQMANIDAVSKRIAQALADAADTLNPDQRKKIDDLLPPVGSHWRPWYRG